MRRAIAAQRLHSLLIFSQDSPPLTPPHTNSDQPAEILTVGAYNNTQRDARYLESEPSFQKQKNLMNNRNKLVYNYNNNY